MNVNEDDDPELAEGPQSPQAAGNPLARQVVLQVVRLA